MLISRTNWTGASYTSLHAYRQQHTRAYRFHRESCTPAGSICSFIIIMKRANYIYIRGRNGKFVGIYICILSTGFFHKETIAAVREWKTRAWLVRGEGILSLLFPNLRNAFGLILVFLHTLVLEDDISQGRSDIRLKCDANVWRVNIWINIFKEDVLFTVIKSVW